jgi:hypothetical protein
MNCRIQPATKSAAGTRQSRAPAHDSVPDELKDPAGDEQRGGHDPECGRHDQQQKQRKRQRDQRNPEHVADPVDRVLMTARVLRDPVIP